MSIFLSSIMTQKSIHLLYFSLLCTLTFKKLPSYTMNLVIDQGNTRCKMAVFDEHDTLHFETHVTELTPTVLVKLVEAYHPNACIFSSVLSENEVVKDWLNTNLPRFVPFTTDTPTPLKLDYQSPGTLGLDRLAAAVGAWQQQPGRTLLVIDMGTAITYDVISRDGIFLGGNIAPGVRLRFQSLHAFTGKLPSVEPTHPFEVFGKETQSAIRAGVMQGIVHEINGYLDSYSASYPDLFAFLTGGDSIYFAENLKSGIFVSKNLVLTGLNAILNHHACK
jgi:type III pantothenate kinase